MNPFPQLQPDIERMVDGLIGHVWPGGHRSPPIMDPRPSEPRLADFVWKGGQAVPVEKILADADRKYRMPIPFDSILSAPSIHDVNDLERVIYGALGAHPEPPAVKDSLTVEQAACVCDAWMIGRDKVCQAFSPHRDIAGMCAECLHDEACHGGGHE